MRSSGRARLNGRGKRAHGEVFFTEDVDVEGARILRTRIAARQWSLAPAVRSGRQPAQDPDAADLEQVGNGIRLYRISKNGGGTLVKKLVDGFWRTEPADETAA